MVGQKAMTFGPSARRLIGRMRPDRAKAIMVVALGVASVALMSIGPRILGHATDLVFAGLFSRTIPSGVTQAQAVEGLRQRGEDTLAGMLAKMDHVVPGQGVDFSAVGDVLMLVLLVYAAAAVLGWLQGMVLNRVVQNTVYRMRQDVEDKINRLPLNYFDRSPRGELLSRVTNDIDNVSQTLQQTMSQLMTSLLTVVAVLTMMFWISSLLALVALISVPISLVRDPGDHEALAGAVRRAVASYGPAQRPHRGGLLRPRAGQGVRPPGGGRADLRGAERRALQGQLRCAVRLRTDHAGDDVHRERQLRDDRRHRRPARGVGFTVPRRCAGVHPVHATVHAAADHGRLDDEPAPVRGRLRGARLRAARRRRGTGRRRRRTRLPAAPPRRGGLRARRLLLQPRRATDRGPLAGGSTRPDGRHRRAHGRRKDHAGQPGDALLRPGRGSDHAGRGRHRDDAAQGPPWPDRDGAAGHLALRGHHPREHRLRTTGRHRGADPRGGAGHLRGPLRALAARRATTR